MKQILSMCLFFGRIKILYWIMTSHWPRHLWSGEWGTEQKKKMYNAIDQFLFEEICICWVLFSVVMSWEQKQNLMFHICESPEKKSVIAKTTKIFQRMNEKHLNRATTCKSERKKETENRIRMKQFAGTGPNFSKTKRKQQQSGFNSSLQFMNKVCLLPVCNHWH